MSAVDLAVAAPVVRPVLLRIEGGARGEDGVRLRAEAARAALALSARESGAVLGPLAKDADDAPLPSNGWHWSVSHARSWAAGAVAPEPVGIDVEAQRTVRQEVVRRVTSRAELELLGGFDWDVFLRVWTAKEAVLKRAGVGLKELSLCTVAAVPGEDRLVLAHRGRLHPVHQVRLDGAWCSVAASAAAGVEWAFGAKVP